MPMTTGVNPARPCCRGRCAGIFIGDLPCRFVRPVEAAREAIKALIHENQRVTRVMIVDDSNGSKFVEWIARS